MTSPAVPVHGPVHLVPTPRLLGELDRLRAERRALELRQRHIAARVAIVKGELAKRPPVEGRNRDGRRSKAQHGTDSGYYAHLRAWKSKPCDACLEAHALAEDVRRYKRSAAAS